MAAQLLMFSEREQQAQRIEDATFDLFWAKYPHKVCKGQARKAWAGAIRKANADTIMRGLQAYIRDKRPDCPWCNPATFLNGERWLDEPADPRPPQRDPDLELRHQAATIARGLPCPSATPRRVAMMVQRGWLTAEQARRAGY